MDELSKTALIEKFKHEYLDKTGGHIKITQMKKWEGMVHFTEHIDFDRAVSLVCDATGWTFDSIYKPGAYKTAGQAQSNKFGIRNKEKVYRRAVIDFICYHNGLSLMKLGKLTGRDHSTIIHSMKTFEDDLDTDMLVRRVFTDISNYVKHNYATYKQVTDLTS